MGIENKDENIDKKNNRHSQIYYTVPQKIQINLNEKIIKIFTSSISDYSFLLTKSKSNSKLKIYGFGNNIYNKLGIFEENNDTIFIPKIINSLKNSILKKLGKIKKIFCGHEHTFVLEGFCFHFLFLFFIFLKSLYFILIFI